MPFASLTIEMKPGVNPKNMSALQEVEKKKATPACEQGLRGALAVVVHYTSIGVKSCPGGYSLIL